MKKILLLLAITLITTYSFSQMVTNLVTLNTNLKVKIEVGRTTTTLTLEGPSTAWFAIGFGGSTMAAGADVVRTDGTTVVDAKATGRFLPVADASQDWTVATNYNSGTLRVIKATRANNTGDADDYVFSPTMTSLSVIWAYGSSATYGNHGTTNRGASMLSFTPYPCDQQNPLMISKIRSKEILVSSSTTGSTYRWLDCDDNYKFLASTGANNIYAPAATGNYAVEQTNDNCTDTSSCLSVLVPTGCTRNRPSITKSGNTLTTPVVNGEEYRWLNCDNSNFSISGETTNSYTAPFSSRYSVEITRTSGCKDTSLCTTVCVPYVPRIIGSPTLFASLQQGATYRWLDCSNSKRPINGEAKDFYTPAASGSYAVEITNSIGCKDSSQCETVCIAYKPSVTVTGYGLTTTPVTGATYQWLNCGTNMPSPITGATTDSYTAPANGTYSVELINSLGCKDTSLCTVVSVGCTTNRPAVTKTGNTLSITAVTGAMYQWLDCLNNNAPLTGASTSENYTPTTSGNHAVEIVRPDGCRDTSVCTVVCVADKPILTKTGAVLSTVREPSVTYRWLDCGNGNMVIANQTSVLYTATSTGSYAIEATRTSGCKDTSVCITVNVGLIENTFASDVKLYPNPTSDKVTIELGDNYSNIAVEITNVLGQVIISKNIATLTHKIVLPIAASNGIYFVRLTAKEGAASFRLIKK